MAKKKRTSIRTASANVQELMRERLQTLATNPLKVLPTADPMPKVLQKIQQRLEVLQAKGPSFLTKRDKGIVGAVAHVMELAKAPGYPRMLDHKIAGQRKFYLQRGQVNRMVTIAVQNHDDVRALIHAYGDIAKDNDLHFFAHDGITCSDTPPDAWWQHLATLTGVELALGDGAQCPHPDRPRVRIQVRSGPTMRICGPCGKRANSMHRAMANHYMGPRRRQPFLVTVRLPDGSIVEPNRESLAEYRAGVRNEDQLVREALAAWREGGGTRYIVGDTVYPTQDQFLAALDAKAWERTALRVMTSDGHQGESGSVATILQEHADRLLDGAMAILDDHAFIRSHAGMSARDLLLACQQEQQRRTSLADLDAVQPSGPIGRFAWQVTQAHHLGEAAQVLRQFDDGNKLHAFAMLQALEDSSFDARFDPDTKASAQGLVPAAKELLQSRTKAALQAYLEASGSGETC